MYPLIMNERNWGGKREGSGRKKGDKDYQTFSVVLPKEELELLRREAKKQNMSVSRFISKYLQLADIVEIEKSRKEGE